MALVLADRVQETTNTTGTGTLTLAGAVSGYQSFSAIGNTNTTYYTIVSGTDWEVGLGTYTSSGTTLSRDTVLSSSAGGTTKITVAAGATVFCDYPAVQAVYQGGALGTPLSGTVTNLTGTASININGTVGATTAAAGAFTTLSASTSVTLNTSGAITLNPTTAGSIDNMTIGATTASTGRFTTLSASSTVSGTGFSTYLASPPAIGGTAAAAGSFTQLTVSGANVNTSISPTGTGTVTISPAGAVTINPTAASTINNTSIGATTASTGRFSNVTTIAGTNTVAPLNFTSGTNLTTAVAGAHEYDGAVSYFTNDATIGRGFIPATSTFRLTTAGTAITNSAANFFGTTSNIPLVSGGFYEIDIYAIGLKGSTSGTVTWTFTNTVAPTLMLVDYEQSPLTGMGAPPGSTAALTNINIRGTTTTTLAAYTFTTGSLSSSVNHLFKFRILLNNSTGTSLKIQLTAGLGTASVTPQAGSVWFARRLPAANTGTFAA